jgi:ABC-type polysaccharide/polyol phosphate transport system ATPase subunit
LDALSVEKAAILGLAGPNGSGKSTLLKLLAFVDRPSKGGESTPMIVTTRVSDINLSVQPERPRAEEMGGYPGKETTVGLSLSRMIWIDPRNR